MQNKKVTVDQQYTIKQTLAQDKKIRDYLKRSESLQKDSEKEQRLRSQKCRVCYYLNRGQLAMQAFWDQPCGICSVNQIYSNSITDIICSECAKKEKLCKHCGGDITV